jgi:hypothetical protein
MAGYNESHTKSFNFGHGKHQILDASSPSIKGMNQDCIQFPATCHAENLVTLWPFLGSTTNDLTKFLDNFPSASLGIFTQ